MKAKTSTTKLAKKQNKKILFRGFYLLGFLLLFFVVIGFFGFIVYHSKLYSISTIEIHADLGRINPEEIRLALAPYMKSNFFELDLKTIEKRLERFPGVSVASVRRVWPHKLIVEIFDQEMVAFWNDNFLMNRFGELYPRSVLSSNAKIPKLYGPSHSSIEVFDYYQQFNRILSPLGVSINKMYLKSDQSWLIVLNTGLEIKLNKKQAFQHLNQFVKVYKKVFNTQGGREPTSVDLRYKHGMAVSWGLKKD